MVRLNHPNIARVYAMGEVDGRVLPVHGVRAGQDGLPLRRKPPARSQGRRCRWASRCSSASASARGCGYAHDAKDEHGNPLHLVHRDLSPANVCISYRGEVKIIDFGAAQSTLKEEQTAPRVVIGNLTYMAPEQAQEAASSTAARTSTRCGVMLWELLAWQRCRRRATRSSAGARRPTPRGSRPRATGGPPAGAWTRRSSRPWPRSPGSLPGRRAFGQELRRLRERLAPGVDESALADLLRRVFAQEKAAEDGTLAEDHPCGAAPAGTGTSTRTRRPRWRRRSPAPW